MQKEIYIYCTLKIKNVLTRERDHIIQNIDLSFSLFFMRALQAGIWAIPRSSPSVNPGISDLRGGIGKIVEANLEACVDRFFLTIAWREREVTRSEFIDAERWAGFYPNRKPWENTENKLATAGFGTSGNFSGGGMEVSGSIIFAPL